MTGWDTLRELSRRWGKLADKAVCEPTVSEKFRDMADIEATVLRHCEKELLNALVEIRAREADANPHP